MLNLTLICAAAILASPFLCGVTNSVLPKVTADAYSTDATTYYSDIEATSGTALLGELHDLLVTTHKTYSTYDDCKDPDVISITDSDGNGGVVEFYSGVSLASSWGKSAQGTWNREHVWCQSLSNGLWGNTYGGSDLQHVRPAESGLNSARNNSPYGIVETHSESTAKYAEDANDNKLGLGGYKANDVFEPLDNKKGDVARILMYDYVHYSTYTAIGGSTDGTASGHTGDLEITSIVSSSSDEEAFSLLLDWNEIDPVDDSEKARNEAAASFQGNRNPFIDNPSYASLIWGGAGISFSSSSLSMNVGDTKSFPATIRNAEGEIAYSSSDKEVASIDENGLVTALKAGQTTLTATADTTDGALTATCLLTVEEGDDLGYFTLVGDPEEYQDGLYLLGAESTSASSSVSGTVFFDASLETPDAENNYHREELQYKGDDIVATKSLLSLGVSLLGTASAFSMTLPDGRYVYSSSGDSNNLSVSSEDPGEAYLNSLSLTDGELLLKGLSGGVFRFNKSSDQLRFRFYKDSTYSNQSDVSLYRYVESPFAKALAYAETVISSLGSLNGEAPAMEAWNALKEAFEALPDEAKESFLSSDDETILEALSLYDGIISAYGDSTYEDFLSRLSLMSASSSEETPSSSVSSDEDSASQGPLIYVIIGIAVFVLLAVGSLIGAFAYKRRKPKKPRRKKK